MLPFKMGATKLKLTCNIPWGKKLMAFLKYKNGNKLQLNDPAQTFE